MAFGLPSIALTGGLYAALVVGGSPNVIALVLLLAATLVHVLSSDFVARANMVLAGAMKRSCFLKVVYGSIGSRASGCANQGTLSRYRLERRTDRSR